MNSTFLEDNCCQATKECPGVGDSWKQSVEAGNEAFEEGRMDVAEEIFLKALEQAEQFGEGDPRLACSLNNLAAVYHAQKKLTLAEPLYMRSLDLKQKLHAGPHPEIALNLHNLGVLYGARRMYPVAETYVKQAIEMKEELFGSEHPALLGTLRYYAALLKVMKRVVDAHLVDARMKAILEKSSGVSGDSAGEQGGAGQ